MRPSSPYPEFSVSHARASTLADCPRRYYYQYYGSYDGWRADAPREARVTYALKQLTAVPLLLGNVVHDAALQCVARVVAGAPLPSLDALVGAGRARMNAAYLTSRRRSPRQFVARPTKPEQAPMLQEIFYHRALDRERAASVRRALEACLANLHASELWAMLRAADPRDILTVRRGQFPSFALDGVTVYAIPDLVYRPDPDAAWVLRDWKTGMEADGAIDQIALQGLYAHSALRLPLVGDRYEAEVANLRRGTVDRFAITADDLCDAVDAVREGVRRMRALLADPAANAPRELAAFPMTDKVHRCGTCNFRHLCQAGTASNAAAATAASEV